MFLFPSEKGIDTLYVVVKASFDIAKKVSISPEQKAVVLADEYWGEPGRSSLKYASEAHLRKPGTDVVVVGEALSPGGRPVAELDITLSVADRSSPIRVFGDRHWEGSGKKARPSDPEPFVRMPVIYERAFGGMQAIEKPDGDIEYVSVMANPVGLGFLGKRSFEEMKDEPLPNLEDPESLITSPTSTPNPVGLGFIAPSWEPRTRYAGTYDKQWQSERAPYLPDDFDLKFFLSAHPNWIFFEHLKGGEPVSISNMSPGGLLEFEIPEIDFSIEVTVAGNIKTPEAHLETVLLEPTEERASLVWRAQVECDKTALKVSEVKIL